MSQLERDNVHVGDILVCDTLQTPRYCFFRVTDKTKANLPRGVWLPVLYGDWTDVPGSVGVYQQRTVRPDLEAVVSPIYSKILALGGDGRQKLRSQGAPLLHYDPSRDIVETRRS